MCVFKSLSSVPPPDTFLTLTDEKQDACVIYPFSGVLLHDLAPVLCLEVG